MNKSVVQAIVVCLLLVGANLDSVSAEHRSTDNIVLITIDGLRWQDLFAGADERLINREHGGVREVDSIRQRFWAESPQERRTQLMPFFWDVVARSGQVFGDVNANSIVRVTNGRYFSYPGYNEILCGFGDPAIDSNAKRPNRNVTVLEWLNQKPNYQGRVAAFGSWDVFPYILWEACQQLDDYRGKTTFVITTDHGRGDDRIGWKSHGASIPGSEYIWIAVIGPNTKSQGQRTNVDHTQAQIAATIAALLDEDFTAVDDRIAQPLPGIVGVSK